MTTGSCGWRNRFGDGELIVGYAMQVHGSGEQQVLLKHRADGTCCRITNVWHGKSFSYHGGSSVRKLADEQHVVVISVEEFNRAWAEAKEPGSAG